MEFSSFYAPALLCLALFMMGFSRATPSQEASENPLPECPDSPNCARESFYFERPTAEIFDKAQTTLQEMNAETAEVAQELSADTPGELKAVFRIRIFRFRDDVHIAVVPAGESGQHAWLHIRSASRTGYSDLGVNARRVSTFSETLKKQLNS